MIDRTDNGFDEARSGFQTAFRHEPALVAARPPLSGPNARVPLVADLRRLGGALRTGGGAVPYREAAYVLCMIAAGEGELPLDQIRPAPEEWDPANLFRSGPAVAA